MREHIDKNLCHKRFIHKIIIPYIGTLFIIIKVIVATFLCKLVLCFVHLEEDEEGSLNGKLVGDFNRERLLLCWVGGGEIF